jgi:hypothetical protein
MTNSAFLLFATSCLFAGVVHAQNLLVVDGQNRPGASFTDLPAAVAAANPGDVLLVRSDGGSYSSFVTGKGLTITADIGQAVLRTDITGPLVVTNLPAGQQFTLRGFLVGPRNTTGPIIQAANCSGRVLLHSLEVGLGVPSIAIQSCAGVLLQESRVLGGYPSVGAQASTVEFVSATLQGGSADARFNQASAPAAILAQCQAVLTACQASGGLGSGAMPPSPALVLSNSSVDAGAIGGLGALRAGPTGINGTGSSPAVTGQSSTMRRDPAMPVLATGPVPAIVGVSAATAQFPGLMLDTHLRSVITITARDIPNVAQVLLVGLPGGPRPIAGIAGSLWLDPASVFVAPQVPAAIAMPPLPIGTVLGAQLVVR